MTVDMVKLSAGVKFQTARSGGKGGQNVNKVETAVLAFWMPSQAGWLTVEQQAQVAEKLANRMNNEGQVMVKSTVHRSQWANRQEALKVLASLIEKALIKRRPRIATRPPAAAGERRLAHKKQRSELKKWRSQRQWD